jgi:hypothetical protein
VTRDYKTTFAAAAGALKDADAAAGRDDSTPDVRLWRPLADQGDAFAQFYLGIMYA